MDCEQAHDDVQQADRPLWAWAWASHASLHTSSSLVEEINVLETWGWGCWRQPPVLQTLHFLQPLPSLGWEVSTGQ